MFCVQVKFSNSGVRFMKFEQPDHGNTLLSFRPVNAVEQATQFETKELAQSAVFATKAVFSIQKQAAPHMIVAEI